MPTAARINSGSNGFARLSGVAPAFQMPPRPSRLTTGEPQLSARAANAATPSGVDRPAPERSTAGIHHGALSTSINPAVSQARRAPAQTTAATPAMIPPGAVSTAGAQASTSRATDRGSPRRTRSPAAAIHGRQAYASRSCQCPMSSRSATYALQP